MFHEECSHLATRQAEGFSHCNLEIRYQPKPTSKKSHACISSSHPGIPLSPSRIMYLAAAYILTYVHGVLMRDYYPFLATYHGAYACLLAMWRLATWVPVPVLSGMKNISFHVSELTSLGDQQNIASPIFTNSYVVIPYLYQHSFR